MLRAWQSLKKWRSPKSTARETQIFHFNATARSSLFSPKLNLQQSRPAFFAGHKVSIKFFDVRPA